MSGNAVKSCRDVAWSLGRISSRGCLPLALQATNQSLNILEFINRFLQGWFRWAVSLASSSFVVMFRYRTRLPAARFRRFRWRVQATWQSSGQQVCALRNGHRELVRVESQARPGAGKEGIPREWGGHTARRQGRGRGRRRSHVGVRIWEEAPKGWHRNSLESEAFVRKHLTNRTRSDTQHDV